MKAILLDIEGTTTPIDFVHRVLFPYSRERIGNFVATHFDSLRHEIEELVDESSHDGSYTIPLDPLEPGSVAAYLEHLIDQDRKSTPLKSIQGKIWQEGYKTGEIRSVVFDDVRPAFERWSGEGKKIAIYSSGSALAQQLLFRHTNEGDLAELIDEYFDTTVGGKRETESYAAIADQLQLEPDAILFLSDIPEELEAAAAAGIKTKLVVRPGNAEHDPAGKFETITSFEGVE